MPTSVTRMGLFATFDSPSQTMLSYEKTSHQETYEEPPYNYGMLKIVYYLELKLILVYMSMTILTRTCKETCNFS